MRKLIVLGLIAAGLAGCVAVTHTPHKPVEQAFQQLDYQRSIEHGYEERISGMLDRIVGPGNHAVTVSTQLVWERVESMHVEVSSEHAAPVSEKSYIEENAGSSIEESTVNYSYPWTKTNHRSTPGQVERISASVLINENVIGEELPPFIEKIHNAVAHALGRSFQEDERVHVTVQAMPFVE